MKELILKLGFLVAAFSFLLGALRDMPLFTVLLRAFGAFLAVELVLIAMAALIIKITEQLRIAAGEEEEYKEEIE